MSKIDPNKQLPIIHNTEVVAKSAFFKIEKLDLEFSNGATRQFERMGGSGRGAVMIVPMKDANTLLLIREYACGTHSYQLGFPKGLIDPGETPEQAANRELQEEVGVIANDLHALHTVHMAPTFFDAKMHILLAKGLSPSRLEGDEPEPLEVIEWPLSEADELLARPDFVEARCIAALLLAQKHLSNA
ncbi:ADP compounds hydrolase NudE [Glaciecola sp. MH2013]|uniref:ADP compounds hydrolase NudE n=1 Tax=Glaciecola sp. MH2013 TaxID=2785524 RepID=UPI00189E5921|nr:ADP compounds hydrolase NudE [Glaciecola sp. MH2013]MBF7074366.1 ADP compounds hydrolase NudE [Glaciecola sp. MH2013]